jgi:hypothetical protein
MYSMTDNSLKLIKNVVYGDYLINLVYELFIDPIRVELFIDPIRVELSIDQDISLFL